MTQICVSPVSIDKLYQGDAAAEQHFGVNMLFDRDRLQAAPSPSNSLTPYQLGVSELGSTTIRYPGGTLAEVLFDLQDPNGEVQNSEFGTLEQMFDPDGCGPASPSTIGLWDTLDAAGAARLSMTFVMPTIRFAGMTKDSNENRFPSVDADLVYNFTIDFLTHAHDSGVPVVAIELGNEWWVDNSDIFGENLTAVEYGRIASELASAIQGAIDDFVASKGLPSDWVEPEILVQTGPGGKAEWVLPSGGPPPEGYTGPKISATELIYREFDTTPEQLAVDGLVTHRYLTGTSVDGWAYKPFDTWAAFAAGNDNLGDMSRYVSEWNVSASNAGAKGLLQVGALVSLFSELLRAGVDQAYIWAVQQGNETNLTLNTGRGSERYSGLSIAGEAFKLLNESVIGLRSIPVNLNSDRLNIEVFGSPRELAVFVTNQTDSERLDTIDVSQIAGRFTHVFGTKIGVAGSDSLDGNAPPSIELIDSQYLLDAGRLRVTLGPYETICLEIPLDRHDVSISGSAGNDDLEGSRLDDVIFGDEGDDCLAGGAGDDTLVGSCGADTLVGDGARDRLEGNQGCDELYGNRGDDRLLGAGGNDLLEGGSEEDSLMGGDGRDSVRGDGGSDHLKGGKNEDRLIGSAGDDHIWGGNGEDQVEGGGGKDTIFGSKGNDRLSGGAGADRVKGGAADDHVSGDSGDDRISGDDGADTLVGRQGCDLLLGGKGADRLDGDQGSDTLSGGKGNDTLAGGKGEDWYWGGAGADVFIFDTSKSGGLACIHVSDFKSGVDTLDFSKVNNDTSVAGVKSYDFIGSSEFSAVAGELRYLANSEGLIIHADVDGDARSNLQIILEGANTLNISDLVL